jgi:hypothetical protein
MMPTNLAALGLRFPGRLVSERPLSTRVLLTLRTFLTSIGCMGEKREEGHICPRVRPAWERRGKVRFPSKVSRFCFLSRGTEPPGRVQTSGCLADITRALPDSDRVMNSLGGFENR